MAEQYPSDATLLALTQDPATGVEYIATGQTPYHLLFRKLLQRLLLVSERANDMRVYQDSDLTIGIRPGRCFISNASQVYAGATGQVVAANSTTHVWLDTSGNLQIGTSGFPSDRSTFLPLAQVVRPNARLLQNQIRNSCLPC